MDQAVRAPAIMQEIIGAGAGANTGAAAPSGQRFRSGTITEIEVTDTTASARVTTNIELSEDEVMEGVEIRDEDRLDGDDQGDMDVSGDTTTSRSSKVTRRKKKSAIDLTFSSGRRGLSFLLYQHQHEDVTSNCLIEKSFS